MYYKREVSISRMFPLQLFRRLAQTGPWLEKRSSHGACVLNYDQKFPQLLVFGGLDVDNKTNGDMWLLSVNHGTWTRITFFLMRRNVLPLGSTLTTLPYSTTTISTVNWLQQKPSILI